jgi:tetrahydromethanopterin S-methyltransferase subunit A
MGPDLYPWGGEFRTGDHTSPVAVVTLAEAVELPPEKVAVHGKMKTENLGIEKVIANVISNPSIRFVIIFGEEIRGHRAGGSLIALHAHGIDENRRIRNAPGAVPYIENLDDRAIDRFTDQVEIVDLLDSTDRNALLMTVDDCLNRDPGPFGEPHIAIQIRSDHGTGRVMADSLALHNSISVSPFLEIGTLDSDDGGIRLHESVIVSTHGRVASRE